MGDIKSVKYKREKILQRQSSDFYGLSHMLCGKVDPIG